jgi:hypothetical protein
MLTDSKAKQPSTEILCLPMETKDTVVTWLERTGCGVKFLPVRIVFRSIYCNRCCTPHLFGLTALWNLRLAYIVCTFHSLSQFLALDWQAAGATTSSMAGYQFKVQLLLLFLVAFFLASSVNASYGDQLPEFRECVEVWSTGHNLPLMRELKCWAGMQKRKLREWFGIHMHVYTTSVYNQLELTMSYSSFTSSTALDLLFGMRLYLSTYHHRAACRRFPASCPIPWQMAVLPLSRHARALLCPILPIQLSCPSWGSIQSPE